jgi:hypothetical protein
MEIGQDRHRHAPGEQHADQHRHADDDADQIAGANQRQRHARADSGGDPADAEEDADLGREDGKAAADHGEGGRDAAADDDVAQTGLARLRRSVVLARAADLEDFGGGDAFRIGQVAFDDHRPAQRHREHHAQYAAQSADARCLPEREARPIADHDEAGQHEDDRRQSASRRGDGLDDIVLENIRALDQPQHRHRDHGGGDGGGEGEPHLQSQIDIRGGENDGDKSAEDDPAQGEFTHRLLQSGLHRQKSSAVKPPWPISDGPVQRNPASGSSQRI